jgi:hypothetical protein
MKKIGVIAAVALMLGLVPAAQADEAAGVYDPGTVNVIELTLPPESVANLEAEPGEYQPGTFAFRETDGTPTGIGPVETTLPVKVKLKGKASFQPLTGKAAFKFKFGKTERFRGLKKMTLNNMIEDPSMTHETLSYAAFRAAGVPASRTGFAYLRVNGEAFGVYLNVETLDEVSLERLFGSFDKTTQHLYEGEDGHDVKPGEAGAFEIDEGEETSRADLEALIEAVNSPGLEPWSTRVEATADLQEMTKMWAVEKYVGHWDGYSGKAGEHQPNNYYLFSDPLGRFQMLPWGTDETWSFEHEVSFDGPGGVMFNFCLEDPTCAAMYREAVEEVVAEVEALDPLKTISRISTLLHPWQLLEAEETKESGRAGHSLQHIAEGVKEAKSFAAIRSWQAYQWLHPGGSGQLPPPGSPPSETAAETPPAPAPAPAATPERRIHILALNRHGMSLRTRIDLPAGGRVTQIGKVLGSGKYGAACRDSRKVTEAGTVTLVCRLSRSVRRALRSEPLRISLVTSFVPPGAGTERLRRRLAIHLV